MLLATYVLLIVGVDAWLLTFDLPKYDGTNGALINALDRRYRSVALVTCFGSSLVAIAALIAVLAAKLRDMITVMWGTVAPPIAAANWYLFWHAALGLFVV
jgi:hypothetical protein